MFETSFFNRVGVTTPGLSHHRALDCLTITIYDKMTVYIKKARANNSTKENEFRKEKFAHDKEYDIYLSGG